jgi:hypothetical protein
MKVALVCFWRGRHRTHLRQLGQREDLLAPKPLVLPQTQHRDAAAAPCEPTAAVPASPSTEETMSHQLGACDNDRD